MRDQVLRQATCTLLGQICKRYQGQTNSRLQAVQLHRGQELILAQLAQYDTSYEYLIERLQGQTDAEYQ